MDVIGYAALYRLQDEVLATIFEEAFGFYLTGGTALSRLYLAHRYSDDLDLFTHDTGLFPEAFRLTVGKLRRRWISVSLEVDARDFKRLRIDESNVKLKLDFVADRVGRVGLPVRMGTLYVDTVANILSNKLCAILGRDEARDIADVLFIARKRAFDWEPVLAEVETKEGFQMEDLLFRLKSFPLSALESVPFTRPEPQEVYSDLLSRICSDLERRGRNSVAEVDSVDL